MQTYDELKVAIASWLNKDDLSEQLDDFLLLAHNRISRQLRCPSNERIALFESVNGNEINIPFDYLECKKLIADNQLLSRSPLDAELATSGQFARNGSKFYLYDEAKTVTLHYWFEPELISESNISNEFLALTPELYLYGALCEAAPFLMDDARIPVWEAKFERVIDEIHHQGRMAEISGGALIQGAYQ